MIYCANCGKGIPDDSHFCTFCGAAVPKIENNKPNEPVPAPALGQSVQQKYSRRSYAGRRSGEFYKNVGFWAAVVVFTGFFLPFYKLTDVSLFDVVRETYETDANVLIWLTFPVSALIIIIQGFTNILPGVIAGIFKVLPFLALILFAIVILKEPARYGFDTTDASTVVNNVGVGLWATVIGSVLMLFFRVSRRG